MSSGTIHAALVAAHQIVELRDEVAHLMEQAVARGRAGRGFTATRKQHHLIASDAGMAADKKNSSSETLPSASSFDGSRNDRNGQPQRGGRRCDGDMVFFSGRIDDG